MSGLAEETIAADEAKVTAQFIAFLKAASEKRFQPGAEAAVQPGTGDRVCGCGVHGTGGTPCGHAGWPVRSSAIVSSVDTIRECRIGNRPRARHPRHVHPRARGRRTEPDAGRHDARLRAEQPSGDDGRGHAWLHGTAAGQRGWWDPSRRLFPHPPERAARGSGRTHEPDMPPGPLVLEYDPYLCGPGRAVKYIVRPGSTLRSPMPSTLTDTYLKDAMRVRLTESEATFDFMIQVQTGQPAHADRGCLGRMEAAGLAIRTGRPDPHPVVSPSMILTGRCSANRRPSTPGTACPSIARSAA